MANNVIIKGFNSLRKLITQGYVSFAGLNAKICITYTSDYRCQKLSSVDFIGNKLSAVSFIGHRLTSSDFIHNKTSSDDFICQKVSTA